jgi:GntR family transcriptional regulator
LIVETFNLQVVRAEETLTVDVGRRADSWLPDRRRRHSRAATQRTTFTRENIVVEVRTSGGRADKFSHKTGIH